MYTILNETTHLFFPSEMARNGLEGTLSPSIGNLTHLQTVLLQNNKISGCLPLEIGKLTQLKTLDVSSNHFTGEIPSSLGYLTQLSYMQVKLFWAAN